LIIPVGSVEQHGPHLPLDTDTRIATAVARSVADRLADRNESNWTLAPAIGYGASGEHEGFPGTVSIGSSAGPHRNGRRAPSSSTVTAETSRR
jgi:mycofactocin precursor peptide peptidase